MSNYKVVFYIRVNIGEKLKDYSMENQKSTLDSWAKEMNWKWVKTYYEEKNFKELKMEKFQEMILDAKNGLFDGILTIDSDRFSKSTKDLLPIMDDLKKRGISIHIHNLRQIDIYSQQGRFILTNLTAFSEFFRKQLSSKIRAGVKQKMKNEWFGQAPFGYTQISDEINGRKKNTRLIENPEEQKILRNIEKQRAEGKSYSEIAEYLNENDIKTRFSKKNRRCIWHPSTVRNILVRSPIKLEKKKREIS